MEIRDVKEKTTYQYMIANLSILIECIDLKSVNKGEAFVFHNGGSDAAIYTKLARRIGHLFCALDLMAHLHHKLV